MDSEKFEKKKRFNQGLKTFLENNDYFKKEIKKNIIFFNRKKSNG